MARPKILVVEDDRDILELLRYNLEKERFQVIYAMTGEAAVKQATAFCPDLIILDLMLPGIDGLEVCRILKRKNETQTIPILMLTAKTEDIDIVIGLEVGADDYVTKPFSPKVLVARIRTILRRKSLACEVKGDLIQIHDMIIHPVKREVTINGIQVELTATEFDILTLLAEHPGWVYSRSQIISAVKGDDYPVTERAIDVQIVGLRKKLGSEGAYIQTVRGVGYRFKEK
ncbi:response regulator transcription factor [bacterium]|nr:response regulator transcription factor [bacterium]